MYDGCVFNMIKGLSPSDRGELEITDLNKMYMNHGILKYTKVKGFWHDAGTPDSLIECSKWVKEQEAKNGR